jgi:hypothetical protein
VEGVRRADGYRTELLDDEVLLYNPAQTRVIALNATAALVWQLCDGTRSSAEIVALIGEAYPEADAVVADVDELLATLRGAGAVEPA